MTKELKKAELAAHAYDGLGAPMSCDPNDGMLRATTQSPLDAKGLKAARRVMFERVAYGDEISPRDIEAAIRAYLANQEAAAPSEEPVESTKYCQCRSLTNPCIVCGKPKFIDREWLKRKIEEDGDEGEIGAGFEIFASPAPVAPVAWSFELAYRVLPDGTYDNWGKPQVSFTRPRAPSGSIRNLRPLFASPAVAPVEVSVKTEEDDPACTDCGRTGVTYQTERQCACQPCPVAWQWRKTDRVMKHEHVWSYVDYHTGLKIKEHPEKYETRPLFLSSIIPATKPAVGVEGVREALFAELGEPDYRLARWPQSAELFHYWSRESIDNAIVSVTAALSAGTATPKPEVEK